MVLARLLAALACSLLLAGGASAATPPSPAPQDLRAFLLRANEAAQTTFPRTPSFAWSPVGSAESYDFQLATSPAFSESSIAWTASGLKIPATSLGVSLPWMTGKPYALYAHVRAVLQDGTTTPWSAPVGFNMTWSSLPAQLASYPGLVRWSTVEGATSYDVWYTDADRTFSTVTNAADEREFYTFHQGASWTGTVHWRVRAVRALYGAVASGLPAVSKGPWSPVFTSTNPAFVSGPLALTATAAENVSDALHINPHQLTPAFVFSGDQSLAGTTFTLYRVYVSTDSACVNTVFRGGIVGSPAYAPRTTGPLALPIDGAQLTAAALVYLKKGDEGQTFEAGDPYTLVHTNETQPAAAAAPAAGAPDAAAPAAAAPIVPAGAPVDLVDSGWPNGRYYWTVVPVRVVVTSDDKTEYHDVETPQDACGAGRVLSFGKVSQPAVTGSAAPYASGLGPAGKLVAAAQPNPSFAKTPLVAWEPALGAAAYELQWSKTRYPWKAEGTIQTQGTSALLAELTPGTWWYRVRGLDPFLPGTAKQMSWSDPVSLAVAQPKFQVVAVTGAKGAKSGKKAAALQTWAGTGFSIGLPATWRHVDPADPSLAAYVQGLPAGVKLELVGVEPTAAGFATNTSVLLVPGRDTTPFTAWAKAIVTSVQRSPATVGKVASSTVRLLGGTALRMAYRRKDTQSGVLSVVQYAFDGTGTSYLVTYTTAPAQAKTHANLFESSARSFRIATSR